MGGGLCQSKYLEVCNETEQNPSLKINSKDYYKTSQDQNLFRRFNRLTPIRVKKTT